MHACPHCGQMLTFKGDHPDLSDIELDNIAQLRCTCPGAARARWINDSEEVIQNALGKNCTLLGIKRPLNEDACQFAKILLPIIYDGVANNITFTEFFGDKITIKSGEKKCKIKRTSKSEINI